LGDHQIKNLKITIPKGRPAGLLVSFQHKAFVADLVLARTDRAPLLKSLTERLGSGEEAQQTAAMLDDLTREMLRNLSSGKAYLVIEKHAQPLLDLYATCTAAVENDGHRFGEGLSNDDKKALTAFLATL
jgi:hypothetical protein